MKKSITLLLIVFLFLMTGCAKGPEGAGAVSGEAIAGTETAAPERFILTFSPEDRNPTLSRTNFVETAEGYYCDFSVGNVFGGEQRIIFFCPRGEDTFYPLCSKPNCRHNDENCNAWDGTFFGYFDGAIYSVQFNANSQLEVVRRSLDGTDHQAVATVNTSGVPSDSGYQFEFHHGKLFVICSPSLRRPLEEQEYHLIVMDLKDYSQTEPAADYLRTVSDFDIAYFCKDKIYAFIQPGKTTEIRLDQSEMIEIDAVTGEIQTLLPGTVSGLYLTDSTWYYFERDIGKLVDFLGLGYEVKSGNPGFRELDRKSGTVKDCGLPMEDIDGVRYDEDFIYATTLPRNENRDRTLYILSRDYELVDQYELKNGQSFLVATSDRIFLSGYELGGDCAYYLDKSQIGSGELKLIPIETIG